MTPHFLARMNVATDLVRRRDIAGAIGVIRDALHPDTEPASAGGDIAALVRAENERHGRQEADLPPFKGQVRRPLADVLTVLKKSPFRRPAGLAPRKGRIAPDPLPAGASFESCSFINESGQRNYKLYVPGHLGMGPRPLVLMLHGCTQDADDFAIGTRMNQLAEEFGFFVAYPEQPTTANQLKCWSWFNPGDQRREGGEPAIIAGITRAILARHRVEHDRIFIAGLSAGGAMAAVMGATYPDLFSAIGVHSGLPFEAAYDVASAFAVMRSGNVASASINSPRRTVPSAPRYIIFHGTADTTVHPANGLGLFDAACRRPDVVVQHESIGADGEPRIARQIAVTSTGMVVAEHWAIAGGSHAWSGGDGRGSYTFAAGPDASREMMRFFLKKSER